MGTATVQSQRRVASSGGACAGAIVLALVASGCARGGAQPDGVDAVASVFPLAWVAEQVAPAATVTLLGAGGQDAHSVDLTPRERAVVEAADVVLYVGDISYQPVVEDAARAAGGEVVDISAVAGSERLIRTAGGTVDPHLWFDADVMADVVLATGEAFASADPPGADGYRSRAATTASEFQRLGRELDDLLSGDCRFDEVVVSHVAYSYLTQPRGKALRGITGANPESGASPSELDRLADLVEQEGLRYVVAEPVEGRADAETLAAETDVELLEIFPLDAVPPTGDSGRSLVQLVREQASTLATAYGCTNREG